jgi:ADP-ribose pyrophosphatase
MTGSDKTQEPRVDKITPLDSSEAKWAELVKIDWTDQAGKPRVWETANRKTRGSSGVDAVAIAAILLHPSRPTCTMVIKQYRPAVGATCVEFPAGLVDEGETVEQAALRELKEETGYTGKIVSITPTIVSDPGLTTANMQFAVVEVDLKEDELPEQHLDSGEFIERFIVPLNSLYDKLMEFSKDKNTICDARLFHFVAGMHFAKENAKKYGLEASDSKI